MYGEGGEGNFIIDRVAPGSPAEKAGFKPGDKIISIDGIDLLSFSNWRQLEFTLKENPEREYAFVIEREEKRLGLKGAAKDIDGAKIFS